MKVQRSTFYRYAHVTGPGYVLVSIRFGKRPADGPSVVRLLARDDNDATMKFDLDHHVAEVVSGVAQANTEFGGVLEVEAIEVVPTDKPQKGQAHCAALEIARSVLRGEV